MRTGGWRVRCWARVTGREVPEPLTGRRPGDATGRLLQSRVTRETERGSSLSPQVPGGSREARCGVDSVSQQRAQRPGQGSGWGQALRFCGLHSLSLSELPGAALTEFLCTGRP